MLVFHLQKNLGGEIYSLLFNGHPEKFLLKVDDNYICSYGYFNEDEIIHFHIQKLAERAERSKNIANVLFPDFVYEPVKFEEYQIANYEEDFLDFFNRFKRLENYHMLYEEAEFFAEMIANSYKSMTNAPILK